MPGRAADRGAHRESSMCSMLGEQLPDRSNDAALVAQRKGKNKKSQRRAAVGRRRAGGERRRAGGDARICSPCMAVLKLIQRAVTSVPNVTDEPGSAESCVGRSTRATDAEFWGDHGNKSDLESSPFLFFVCEVLSSIGPSGGASRLLQRRVPPSFSAAPVASA